MKSLLTIILLRTTSLLLLGLAYVILHRSLKTWYR